MRRAGALSCFTNGERTAREKVRDAIFLVCDGSGDWGCVGVLGRVRGIVTESRRPEKIRASADGRRTRTWLAGVVELWRAAREWGYEGLGSEFGEPTLGLVSSE